MLPELPQIVAKNIQYFTGRTWLLSPLLQWLSQSKDRMFLIVGGPGIGKSTIIAWLAGWGPLLADVDAKQQVVEFRSSVGAAHFCSFASGGSVDPKTFTQNIVKQLALHINGFSDALLASFPEPIRVDVKQQVDKVEPGGNVVGILIEHLTLNLGTLSDEASFNRGLRDPLKKLYQDGYDKPMVLLVDALDESTSYTGNTDIVQLLSRIDDLPEQVRILATTRPDPMVLKNYRKVKSFDLIKDAPANVDDVGIYVYNRLEMLDETPRMKLVDRIKLAAASNFLYAHLLLDDLLPHLSTISNIETFLLPKGLAGLYHQFLNRKWGKDEGSWYETYKPLLGMIAVAQGEGLSLIQINAISGRDSERSLRVISQYLTGNWPQGPFRLFHKSFVDFLLEDEENIDYRIDAANMHSIIVKYYQRRYCDSWEQLDDYGIAHLLRHLLESDNGNKLEGIRSDEYAIRHLFFHMKEANLYNVIGEVVRLVGEL